MSRKNVLLTAEHTQQFESAVSQLQLISSPRCPPVADAGILFVTIQNTSGVLKTYVDSVTCGYGSSYSGVLEYETILNVLTVTKGLVGK